MEARMARPRSLVGPAILIALGVLFLCNNLGLIDQNTWRTIAPFWPLILVAIGLDIMVRRSTLGGIGLVVSLSVVLLVALAGLAAVAFMAPHITLGEQGMIISNSRTSGPVIRLGGPVHEEAFSQALNGAERAAIDLNMGVGRMSVTAMAEASGLVEGTLALAEDERVSREYYVRGGTGYFKLNGAERSVGHSVSYNGDDRRWDLRLNPSVPTNLKVNTGVGTTYMDLSQMRLTSLSVNGGVGNTEMTLPQKGQLHVTVKGGVGQTTILVPKGMAARIQVERGLSGIDVDGDYRKSGDVYSSRDFDQAQDKVEMKIHGGVGKITVRES